MAEPKKNSLLPEMRGLSWHSPVSGWRVFFVIVSCTTISIVVLFSLLLRGVSSQVSAILGSVAQTAFERHGGLGCLREPASWGISTPLGAKVFTYDIRTLKSMNPKAPEIPRPLREALVRLQQRQYPHPSILPAMLQRRSVLFGRGGVYFYRLAEKGPCSLLMVRWMPELQRHIRGMVRLMLIFLGGLFSFFFFGYFVIVRPLLRRIEGLAQLAHEVGREETVLEIAESPIDELDGIKQSLALAHQRILDDKQRLSAQSLALSRHMADIAHDLRTPIASLQLHLERMSQGHREDTPAALADVVYLENLTDNLGFSARLQSELMQPFLEGDCALNDVVTRVAGRFRLLAQELGVSLEFACPDRSPRAFGQALLYERALSNLVHNAIRYVPSQGHVAILLEAQASTFSLQVLDDGPGVLPAELPRLQERTWRAENARQRDPTGQGLGLAITAEICHRLDLQLSFEIIEPQGLHVSITGNRMVS